MSVIISFTCAFDLTRHMESGDVYFVQTVSLFLSAVLKAPFLLFSPGIWFLLPWLTSLISRMTVTKTPSQTKPKSQPVIPATPPPQPSTIHPTPVVVGHCKCFLASQNKFNLTSKEFRSSNFFPVVFISSFTFCRLGLFLFIYRRLNWV